jgi:hypothetical protein
VKIILNIRVTNHPERMDEYINTGDMGAIKSTIHEVEIEIPDLRKGFHIATIDIKDPNQHG